MKEEYEDLKFLTNISTNILINCNIYGLVTYCNRRYRHIFDKQEIAGKYLSEFFDFETAQKIQRAILDTVNQNSPRALMVIIKERSYNFFIYPNEGEASICIEDITERKQLSEILTITSQRLNFAEKTAKLGYWEVDIKNKKIFWSAEMFRIFGVDAQNVSMKKNIIKEQIIKEDLPVYKQKLRELLSSGNPVEGSVRIKRPNDKIAHCFFKADLFLRSDHEKIAGTFQDLTDLIEIQHQLDAARKTADRLNRAKSYFLAEASHDLRQPLQALAIFINTLQDEKLSPNQHSLVDKIDASSQNLRNLLDNLLDISKLEAGGIEAQKSQFNMGSLLNNILLEYEDLAISKGIILKTVPCNYIVESDPILLERVIRNFLSNAFKYTKNKILVGCKKKNGYLQIMVIDNGVGIESSEHQPIFDEFYQSLNIPNNKKNGSGLGLTIVKKIAEILDAKVGVKSTLNQGSCFYLELDTIKTPKKH